MPRVFDNIEYQLLPQLRQAMELSSRADFCVGYFNLRGWKAIDSCIEPWAGGPDNACRLLIGMQRLPQELLRSGLSLTADGIGIDNQAAVRLKKRLAEEFRTQLMIGAPNNEDEEGLQRLARQIRCRKVIVKLFLRYPLHAKLYLLFRSDPLNPITGYLGSSNLTFAGLSHQGELNIDVMDHDATQKLARWFEERWDDRWCIDISDELAEIIETSWAREELLPPYHVYLKMAYHLSREAREGVNEFRIPREFGDKLFDFQIAAVKIAAHHLNKRGGVIIGDVVGLGKTLMATALARIFQEDHLTETLIICPKNLEKMWQDYVDQYRLIARVLPITEAGKLADLRRYRIVLIDESHNLRNREGMRYRAIQEYINKNDSRCILLTATPYNKTYLDLSGQLRLFVNEHADLGIRPETLIREIGETEFIRRHQAPVRSLAAFEKSDYPDDWRELMRLYLVRRTRSFIEENYAKTDSENGRKYLTFEDGSHSYFPTRIPKTIKFTLDDADPDDQYARLFSSDVVRTINTLNLPRYGLGNYITASRMARPTTAEAAILGGLSRAGRRLMGFSRTNLFKRLESGGGAFIQSVDRHILRNFVFLHAIENGLDVPIGTQEPDLLDPELTDQDTETRLTLTLEEDYGDEDQESVHVVNEQIYRERAAQVYRQYVTNYSRRFKWLRSSLFDDALANHLRSDAHHLIELLQRAGPWDPDKDEKLSRLIDLLQTTHPNEKVIIFTQFADTVHYLTEQIKRRGVTAVEGVTGDSADPTTLAWRFSPVSNGKRHLVAARDELRVLVATDVLSEGQNLQDCHIAVNYDLPWAIIRLIQRAGRIDRIGQTASEILCYSFLPADGIEQIIQLRSRVIQRLTQNDEVIGTDERFFDDVQRQQTMLDLYNEKAGILDGDGDTEVDLASYAYQIWKNATDAHPPLTGIIHNLPDVVYSTRAHDPAPTEPEGVIVYIRTADGNDALALIDREGHSVTQSQLRILQLAACRADVPAIARDPAHHELVQAGVKHLVSEETSVGGQLGKPSSARFKTYERLKRHAEQIRGTIFDVPELHRTIEEIYRYPLRTSATDILNRQMRAGIDDQQLAEIVIALGDEDRLCIIHDDVDEAEQEPRIICSLGLFTGNGEDIS